MGLFGTIMNKIFHHGDAAAAAPAPAEAVTADAAPQPSPQPVPTPPQPVDVEAVLTQLAAQKGGGGNWQTSIVDLLKLLDLDSSLSAREELADELGVHAGPHGSAEQNIALQKAVWENLAQNGGKVSDSLKAA